MDESCQALKESRWSSPAGSLKSNRGKAAPNRKAVPNHALTRPRDVEDLGLASPIELIGAAIERHREHRALMVVPVLLILVIMQLREENARVQNFQPGDSRPGAIDTNFDVDKWRNRVQHGWSDKDIGEIHEAKEAREMTDRKASGDIKNSRDVVMSSVSKTSIKDVSPSESESRKRSSMSTVPPADAESRLETSFVTDLREKAAALKLDIVDSNSRGLNTTILSIAIYYIYKQLSIKSLVDLNCLQNANWIRTVLRVIGEDDESFRFYCIDETDQGLKDAVASFRGSQNIYFMKRNLTSIKLYNMQMVIAVDLFPSIRESQALEILQNLRENQVRIFLSTSNPMRANEQDFTDARRLRPVNLRASPYQLGQPSFAFDHILMDHFHFLYPTQLLAWEVERAFPLSFQDQAGS